MFTVGSNKLPVYANSARKIFLKISTVIKYYEGCETTAGTKAFAETQFHCLTDQLLQEEDYFISADK